MIQNSESRKREAELAANFDAALAETRTEYREALDRLPDSAAASPANETPEALEACREQRVDLLELIEAEREQHAEALNRAWHEGYGAGSSNATDGWLHPGSPNTPCPYPTPVHPPAPDPDETWVAFTSALGYGDNRTEPAATPEQLLPILQRALDAEHEHIECEAKQEAESCARGETDCLDDCYHRDSPYWPNPVPPATTGPADETEGLPTIQSVVDDKADPSCRSCEGDGWVCENHPTIPFEAGCACGGAGAPCACTTGPADGRNAAVLAAMPNACAREHEVGRVCILPDGHEATGGTDEAEGLADLGGDILHALLTADEQPNSGRMALAIAQAILASDWLRERDLARDARTRADAWDICVAQGVQRGLIEVGHSAELHRANPYRADRAGGAS